MGEPDPSLLEQKIVRGRVVGITTNMRTTAKVVEGIKPCCYAKKMKVELKGSCLCLVRPHQHGIASR